MAGETVGSGEKPLPRPSSGELRIRCKGAPTWVVAGVGSCESMAIANNQMFRIGTFVRAIVLTPDLVFRGMVLIRPLADQRWPGKTICYEEVEQPSNARCRHFRQSTRRASGALNGQNMSQATIMDLRAAIEMLWSARCGLFRATSNDFLLFAPERGWSFVH